MTDREAVDTLVRGTIVNVHTGTLEEGAVAIDDGEIVALAERPADRELTAEYVAPGLLDAHVHVESSMVTPSGYSNAVVPHGVTGIVWDPHEIANVLGEAGVRAAMADCREIPLKAHFAVPSSVPASPLQDGGATLDADAVEGLLDADPVVALAEVMDLFGVVESDRTVHDKISAARERGLTVDGHLPRVSGALLQTAARYLDTDHESISEAEAREKLAAGIRVYLRASSITETLPECLRVVEDVDSRWVSLATDDRDVVDIYENGGVNVAVETALAEGYDPVEVVTMATLNTAEAYGLPSGRITPGAPADLVLLDDLDSWAVETVMIDGELDPTDRVDAPDTAIATGTVSFTPVDPADLAHATPGTADSRTVRAIDCTETETTPMEATVPVADSRLVADTEADVLPIAVVERHGNDGGVGTGFAHGFGLDRGAIASTVAHDAHNLIVAGTTHEAMARVANDLREADGGYAVYDPEADRTTVLELPVAGLMSDRPVADVAEDYRRLREAGRTLGLDDGGFVVLSVLGLEVVPQLRITNRGLVDVTTMEYVDLVVSG